MVVTPDTDWFSDPPSSVYIISCPGLANNLIMSVLSTERG